MSNDKVPKSPEASTEPNHRRIEAPRSLAERQFARRRFGALGFGLTTPHKRNSNTAAPALAAAGQRPTSSSSWGTTSDVDIGPTTAA